MIKIWKKQVRWPIANLCQDDLTSSLRKRLRNSSRSSRVSFLYKERRKQDATPPRMSVWRLSHRNTAKIEANRDSIAKRKTTESAESSRGPYLIVRHIDIRYNIFAWCRVSLSFSVKEGDTTLGAASLCKAKCSLATLVEIPRGRRMEREKCVKILIRIACLKKKMHLEYSIYYTRILYSLCISIFFHFDVTPRVKRRGVKINFHHCTLRSLLAIR